ncbi:MAG: hypothetical protein HOJ35_02240 [Bdellovibrionales bacterium]|nr:hypothetical protein [Bdellovibrionales bacterium]
MNASTKLEPEVFSFGAPLAPRTMFERLETADANAMICNVVVNVGVILIIRL